MTAAEQAFTATKASVTAKNSVEDFKGVRVG